MESLLEGPRTSEHGVHLDTDVQLWVPNYADDVYAFATHPASLVEQVLLIRNSLAMAGMTFSPEEGKLEFTTTTGSAPEYLDIPGTSLRLRRRKDLVVFSLPIPVAQVDTSVTWQSMIAKASSAYWCHHRSLTNVPDQRLRLKLLNLYVGSVLLWAAAV